MATMVDLLDAAKAAGLLLEVTPDFRSNGHNDVLLQSPSCGYLHHTDARALISVYYSKAGAVGWPAEEWRPTVPSPRCQVYAARARTGGCRAGCPFKGRAHLVFVSAGVAYQAGMANGGRIAAAQAGKIGASTPNAADAGLADTMNANDEAMGIEIDWAEGEDWPADLLELVCQLMALAVRTFGWPGVGAWIRHRQATRRKPDPETDFDFWTRAAQILHGEDDPMAGITLEAIGEEVRAELATFKKQHLDGTLDRVKTMAPKVAEIDGRTEQLAAELAALRELVAQLAPAGGPAPAGS